jgi:hypothetical protein
MSVATTRLRLKRASSADRTGEDVPDPPNQQDRGEGAGDHDHTEECGWDADVAGQGAHDGTGKDHQHRVGGATKGALRGRHDCAAAVILQPHDGGRSVVAAE